MLGKKFTRSTIDMTLGKKGTTPISPLGKKMVYKTSNISKSNPNQEHEKKSPLEK